MGRNACNIKYVNRDIFILQVEQPHKGYLRIYNVYNEPQTESTTRSLEIIEDELQNKNHQAMSCCSGTSTSTIHNGPESAHSDLSSGPYPPSNHHEFLPVASNSKRNEDPLMAHW